MSYFVPNWRSAIPNLLGDAATNLSFDGDYDQRHLRFDGTRLVLTQRGFPDAATRDDFAGGWSGLGWVERILKSMEDGCGQTGDLDKLASLAKMWNPGNTFCALAPGAAEPVQSALKYFRADFERHISEQRCPWR